MFAAFLHGFILAFGLILPLGAQNVFVFNQGAVQPQLRRAFPVVLTAAMCDTLLILLAVLGVSVLVLSTPWIEAVLVFGGAVFLIYMGFVTYRSKPSDTGEQEQLPAKKQILFAASVSLLNPHAILDTIGVIGTSSISYEGPEKLLFTASCIFVSWLWFFSLATAGRWVGTLPQSSKWMVGLNKASGLIIWFTAIYLLITY